jgi:hypothetical protein
MEARGQLSPARTHERLLRSIGVRQPAPAADVGERHPYADKDDCEEQE